MSEPPRRKRFQIHLSTAIVMMVVAGGVIWANVRERHDRRLWSDSNGQPMIVLTGKQFGFPMTALEAGVGASFKEGYPFLDRPIEWRDIRFVWASVDRASIDRAPYPGISYFSFLPVAANAIVALLVLASVCFLCEWLIHRRAARKEA